jgi:hypothetical protein
MKLQDHEVLLMTTDRLDLDSDTLVVNFDVYDKGYHEVTKDAGYVCIRQEDDCFTVTVFDCNGTVLSETNVPHKFKTHSEDDDGESE